jgi:hypothetical protein
VQEHRKIGERGDEAPDEGRVAVGKDDGGEFRHAVSPSPWLEATRGGRASFLLRLRGGRHGSEPAAPARPLRDRRSGHDAR